MNSPEPPNQPTPPEPRHCDHRRLKLPHSAKLAKRGEHRIAHASLLLGIRIQLPGKIFKHAKAISSRAARDCQILPLQNDGLRTAGTGRRALAWDWERWLLRANSRRNTAEP